MFASYTVSSCIFISDYRPGPVQTAEVWPAYSIFQFLEFLFLTKPRLTIIDLIFFHTLLLLHRIILFL